MGKPRSVPSKATIKREPKQNRPGGRRYPVAFIPPIARVKLQELHRTIDCALPIAVDQITTENLKRLDDACWEPGLTTGQFRERYRDAMVLKRWQGGSSDDAESRRQSAYAKLLESEVRCRETNRNFYGPEALDWSNARIPLHLLKVYNRARRIIGRLLGQFDWELFPSCVDFSPGATTEFPRRSSKVSNKWQSGSHITPRATPYGKAFRTWCKAPPMDFESTGALHAWPEFRPIECNTVFTVPKRFDTDRTAAKGTTWNTALQKGVGSMVRSRCQRWSDPLLRPDAQVLHGLMAKLGSRTGLFVTGDLSGASDSVTTGHVSTFFPESWSKVMLDLREEYGQMPDGSIVRWEKVGSMGNGFTFEVETVLFYGLVKACCKSSDFVSVYGDDLIYPETAHELVVEAMSFCGFEFNREKTYSGSHPFRESCGAYYHAGVDVKPYFIENLPATLGSVIQLHNDIVGWHRTAHPDGPWGDVVAKCRELVPKRYWGPLGVAGVLWCEWDEATPRFKPSFQSWALLSVLPVVTNTDDLAFTGRYLSYLWRGFAKASGTTTHAVMSTSAFQGVLTGYPLADYLYPPGGPVGYVSNVENRERCVTQYVDKTRWVQLSARNIELMTRAYYQRT